MREHLPAVRKLLVDPDATVRFRVAQALAYAGEAAAVVTLIDSLPDLPLTWDRNAIKFAGKSYDASTHVPALIYPNFIDGKGYVVLNSGHTFHAAEFNGTNALLYPRLGDFAILKPMPTEKSPNAAEVVTAGLFDEEWKVPAK